MPEKFEAVAERWLDVTTRGSEEWMCSCPWCPGTQSLQFNVLSGLWLCFRCGEKGTAKSLVERLGGSFSNPATSFDEVEKSLDSMKKQMREARKGEQELYLPETYLARFNQGKPHEHWTRKRNYSGRTIKEWGLGYDPIGPRIYDAGKWVNLGASVTLPYRTHHGDLLGIFHRRLDSGFPRYLYPKHFDRTGSLFGSWKVDNGKPLRSDQGLSTVVLAEGSTDTIRIHQSGFRAVGQYGSSLHPDQVRLLRQLGVEEIVLFYDYDASGIKATHQALTVLNGFFVRSVQWDANRFCWHGKLCDCGMGHKTMELGFCKKKKRCRCGREHDVDPGDWKRLSEADIQEMVQTAPLMGREKSWAKSRSKGRVRRTASAVWKRQQGGWKKP